MDWHFIERVLSSKECDTALLWGPPGTGKTYTGCRVGLGNRECFNVTLTPETPAAEFRGFWMPQGQEFAWMDGVFVKAMREGARLVINEISHASHDVLAILFPVLESKETAALTLPTSETVRPADGFQVIVTDNSPPEQLPEAIRGRFKATMHVTEAHPEAFDRLEPHYREAARRTAGMSDGRGASIREWLAVQSFERSLGMDDAFAAVFGEEKGRHLKSAVRMSART